MLEKFLKWWCYHFHGNISRPILTNVGFAYTCFDCGREVRETWKS